MVSTNPVDLPPFFDERPSGMPTSISTRHEVARANRRLNSIQYHLAFAGASFFARSKSSLLFNSAAGSKSRGGRGSAGGNAIGISVCSKVEIVYWSALAGSV